MTGGLTAGFREEQPETPGTTGNVQFTHEARYCGGELAREKGGQGVPPCRGLQAFYARAPHAAVNPTGRPLGGQRPKGG
jgi:hypothetical protein